MKNAVHEDSGARLGQSSLRWPISGIGRGEGSTAAKFATREVSEALSEALSDVQLLLADESPQGRGSPCICPV